MIIISLTVDVIQVIAMILQYSGVNAAAFRCVRINDYFSSTFGRIAEFLPYAALGSIIGDRIHKAKGGISMNMRMLLCALTVVAGLAFVLLSEKLKAPGFGYSGLPMFCSCTCVMILVFSVKVRANKFFGYLFWLSTFTGGIYYVHKLVGSILSCMHIAGGVLTLTTFALSLAIVFAISKLKRLNMIVK